MRSAQNIIDFKSARSCVCTLVLSSLLVACGGSDSGNNSSGQITSPTGGTGGSGTGTGSGTQGQYDLSNYLFHADALSTNGDVSFSEQFYSQETGDSALTLTRRFSNAGEAVITEYSDGELIKTFNIGETAIVETLHDVDDAVRYTARYADIGDVFLDADHHPDESDLFGMGQNTRCELVTHLDQFNLGDAGGSYSLASGVVDDVLEVTCVTSFLSGGTLSPHTNFKHYFARGIGVIYTEGTAFFLGAVYIVENY